MSRLNIDGLYKTRMTAVGSSSVNGAEKCSSSSSKQQLTVPKKVLLTVPRNMVNGAELF